MTGFIENFELYLNTSPLLAIITAFAAGLITSFTPCTYPMIPITVGVIGNKSVGNKNKLSGFLYSLVYVSGMASTYAAMGMFAALTGRFFGEINSNPWIFFFIGNILFILALIMLDVIKMPTLAAHIRTDKKKGIFGIFLIGMASGLVAGPCTAPVLAIALAYVATTKSIILGGTVLFVFAFGMGALLILAGTFSGFLSSLPKSGNWMNRIKMVIAILMFAAGEYFLIKMGQMLF